MTINHIFVYGTLRLGHGACKVFGLEEHGTYAGTYQLKGAQMYHLGGFPGIKLVDDDQSIITGDLFEIKDPELLNHLDAYEGYDPKNPDRSLYIRRTVEVNGVPCYTYEYNRSTEGRRPLETGDWSNQRCG